MICFVILHYQAIDETRKCIKAIGQNITDEYKIIVVDNASPNKTGETLIEEYKEDAKVEIILSNDNLGFAKGNNMGYKFAKQYNPDFIVVLNSDVEITQNDFCDRLKTAYIKYKFDVLGPDIYSTKLHYHQNPQRESNYTIDELNKEEKKLNFKNKFSFLLKIKYLMVRSTTNCDFHENDYKSIQLGKVLHGACYVFSSKFIGKYEECFYPRTFMYYESYILHYICMKDNLVLLYYPDIIVEHNEDASTNATYKNQYKKSIFVNRCLLNSCREYINLIKKNYKLRGK